MARQFPFVAFNGGSPFNLIQQDDIPVAALKSLPFFTREDQTTPIEHIRDIASLYGVDHVTQKNVALRLLFASFKGKALQWFRGLTVGLVATWDDLGEKLYNQFKDKSDHLSLVEQLKTIKRAPQEQISNFNIRFQRTWDKVPVTIEPYS